MKASCYLIQGVRLPVSETDEGALSYMKQNLQNAQISIYKKSVDARKKEEICFVYTFLVTAKNLPLRWKKKAVPFAKKEAAITFGSTPLSSRPIVVGAGPAGLFCAYLLAKNGYCPLVLERGEPIDQRVKTVNTFFSSGKLNPNSNVQFGEGGAGAFSDGKLTTRINDPLSAEVVKVLAQHSDLPHLSYQAKPHIGTDRLQHCVKSLRQEIERLGGSFRFSARLTDLRLQNGRVTGVTINGEETLSAQVVVLATGHSAKDIYELLYQKEISLSQKSFSVGARVEHFRQVIDEIQYGSFAGHPHLGAADYSLFHHLKNRRTAYSFCMCPGGVVVPSQSEEETVLVNGMSNLARDGVNSNSAICVSVSGEEFGNDLFGGLCFIESLEKTAYQLGGRNGKAPFMTSGDFTGITPTGAYPQPTYSLGVTEADFSQLFPPFVTESLREGLQAFEQKMPGFLTRGAIFTGVETRTSSPIRIVRNDSLQSEQAAGLYPCGEGAGYAGGIVSAGVDGLRIGLRIVAEYQPMAVKERE